MRNCRQGRHHSTDGPDSPAKIPLSRANLGQCYKVVALMAGRGLGRRLTSLGLNINATIQISHLRSGGAMVVARGDTRIALGAGMAEKILVEPVTNAPCSKEPIQ